MHRQVNAIAGRLSLRAPQRHSLEILDRITELATLKKGDDPAVALEAIKAEWSTVTDFEREFPSVCFALATGVGKTRLMGAFVTYLHLAHGARNFFILAPNLTIYSKLIADFTPNTPKYVFKGIAEFAAEPPQVITGDNYDATLLNQLSPCRINIFNIAKINSEVRGGRSPRIKRLSEYIGESYFDYLANLDDLVLLIHEAQHQHACARGKQREKSGSGLRRRHRGRSPSCISSDGRESIVPTAAEARANTAKFWPERGSTQHLRHRRNKPGTVTNRVTGVRLTLPPPCEVSTDGHRHAVCVLRQPGHPEARHARLVPDRSVPVAVPPSPRHRLLALATDVEAQRLSGLWPREPHPAHLADGAVDPAAHGTGAGREMTAIDDHGQPFGLGFNAHRRAERDISELLGLLKGVLADGVVSQGEADFVRDWTASHPDARTKWPVSAICARIDRIFADGHADDAERDDLRQLFEQIVGGKVTMELKTADGAAMPFDAPVPTIAIGELYT